MQGEERNSRRHAAIAVGYQGGVPVLGYTRLSQLLDEFFFREEGAVLGLKEAVGVEVPGARYVAGAPLSSCYGTCVLPLVASVEDKGAIFARGEHVLRLLTPPATQPRVKDGGLDGGHLGGGRVILGGPLLPTPVEDGDAVVTVVEECPPQAGGELATRVVVDDDVGSIPDA